jgi:hypothetical protein
MAPPLPSISAASGTQTGQSSQPPPTLPQPDIFADLIRLGLNPDDMTKQPQVSGEVLKNLQAMLGKRDSADLLRKLLPLNNDWPNSSAPADYQRVIGSSSGSSGGNRDHILSGSILSGAGGGAGGAVSFANNIINGNSSQQQEQDVQYASAQQQQQQHQATASAVNHHQHFRIPTTNTTMHNSPMQQQQQQQQLLSQHKSVLSLHHQQHHLTHPHQNDSAHRQRINQQHKLNSVPNSSIANLNEMSGAPHSSSLSSSNVALLDTKNSTIFSHRTSPAISPYTIPSGGATPRVPNTVDAIGGQPSLDNMHDATPLQQPITMNNRDKLKLLAKHQQMQKQFRTTSDKNKNLQWSNPSSSSANLNLMTDSQNQQRIAGCNINNNNIGLSQLHRQITSPLSSAISPPQASPGLPKSLLNLAACSTSPPNANSISANSRLAGQMSNVRNANVSQVGSTGNNQTKNRSIRNNSNNGAGLKIPSNSDPSNILQQIMGRPSNNKNSASNSATRSNYSNFSLSSLLSDDQSNNPKSSSSSSSSSGNNNNRSVMNQNAVSSMKTNPTTCQPIQRRPSSAKSDDSNGLQASLNVKDAFSAYLQEKRGPRSNVSVGEIACSSSNQIVDQPNQLQNVFMAQPETNEQYDESQGDIETALSRVEARNDLSLLYPPVSLASNSQKQINALSAGMELPDVDLFTDEIKKIVQEGCNIIYECKTCSNLFRSLANLIKHKRLYCKEINKANQFELARRSQISSVPTVDMSVTKNPRESVSGKVMPGRDNEDTRNSMLVDNQSKQSDLPSASIGSQKYNLRGKRVDVSCLTGDTRSSRGVRNPDKLKDNRGQSTSNARIYSDNLNQNSGQTNLSRLLQSQPKNRVIPMKDSALMDALSMGPNLTAGSSRNVTNSPIGNFNEQLVRNSSLAKTLLSENVKSINGNFETTNAENNAITNQKPTATPKRKFLEDCIRKVKRDKLGPTESGDSDCAVVGNQATLNAISQDGSEPYRDPLDIYDSEADSDALIMDIDESYSTPTPKRVTSEQKPPSRSQTHTATSSHQSTSRLNSSSALLKALTRPVEPRTSYPTATSQKIDIDKQSRPSSSLDNETKTNDNKSILATDDSTEKSEKVAHVPEHQEPSPEQNAPPLSPILEKFGCEACSTEFPDHQTLFDHIISDHKSVKKIHPCIFCSLSFITLENVCRHIIEIHKKTKLQVGRLKDVVESRSFYSNDFGACADLPTSCKDDAKSKVETERKNITPDALSDLAATEQILNDTVALVSLASSPTKSAAFSPPKRLPSLVARSSSRLAAKRSPLDDAGKDNEDHRASCGSENLSSQSRDDLKPTDVAQDEADDLLSDTMIPNITDEHLAMLERQEAEIEAERLRKRQDEGSMNRSGAGCSYRESDTHPNANDDFPVDDDSSATKTQLSIEEASVDGGSIEHEDFVGEEDSSQTSSRPDDQGEKNVIKDELSSQGEIEDSQSTQELSQRIVSKGKQVCMAAQDEAEINHLEPDDVDDKADDAESQDQSSWGSEERASASSSSSSSSSQSDDSSESNDTEETDSESNTSGANEPLTADIDDDNDVDTNDQVGDCDSQFDYDDDDVKPQASTKKKGSYCGSIKSETDLNSSDIGDKYSKQEYHDNTSSHSSSKASSKPSTMSTIDGTGGCKLKLKAASSREVSGGSGAITNSSGASSSGIMKLKIQLKTQPDEKSKIYRIVE